MKFEEAIAIECTPEYAFDYTQDYKKRLKWDTFLRRADLIKGAKCAEKGVEAYCETKKGLGMITEYVSFDRPNVTAIKMTKGPFMFKSFSGSWRFKKIEGKRTKVIFLYSFQLRFPFTLLTRLILKQLKLNVRERLIDLKKNVETSLTYTT